MKHAAMPDLSLGSDLSEYFSWVAHEPDGITLDTDALRLLPREEADRELRRLIGAIFRAKLCVKGIHLQLGVLNRLLDSLTPQLRLGDGLVAIPEEGLQALGKVRIAKDIMTAYLKIEPLPAGVCIDGETLVAHLWMGGVRFGYRAPLLKGAIGYLMGTIESHKLSEYYRTHAIPPAPAEGYIPVALGKKPTQEGACKVVHHFDPKAEGISPTTELSHLPGFTGCYATKGALLAVITAPHTTGIRVDGKPALPGQCDTMRALSQSNGIKLQPSAKEGYQVIADVDGVVCVEGDTIIIVALECPLGHRPDEEDSITILEEISTEEEEAKLALIRLKRQFEKLLKEDGRVVNSLFRTTETLQTLAESLNEERYHDYMIERNRQLTARAAFTPRLREMEQSIEQIIQERVVQETRL